MAETWAPDTAGLVVLPDGTAVRGRGRRDPMPAGQLPEYALHLGGAGGDGLLLRSRTPKEQWPPDWPADRIDWPDFRTPRDGDAAAAALVHAYRLARAGQRVELACGGGTGRTGTAIACLAVLAGHPAADAVAWTRAHYRPRAVETPGQRRWIAWFAEHAPAPGPADPPTDPAKAPPTTPPTDAPATPPTTPPTTAEDPT